MLSVSIWEFLVVVLSWLMYGAVLLVTLYQIFSMKYVWEELRHMKRRAIRFRVLMAVFSASRFGEIALDIFGSQTVTVRSCATRGMRF